jgi:hypothetical protein
MATTDHRRQIRYRPVHPSALSEYDSRDDDSHAVGDFVMHGLGGLMKMVSKEYGLRQSESFYVRVPCLEPEVFHADL